MAKYSDQFESPGEAIKHLLDERDWTQEDLAQILSISAKHTNELVKNKKPLSFEMIFNLSRAFDFSSERLKDFVNLYTRYQIANIESNPEKEESDLVAERAKLFSKIPVSEMIKRGWLEKTSDYDKLDFSLKGILGVDPERDLLDALRDELKLQNLHYRKSDKEAFSDWNAILWKKFAAVKASELPIRNFNRSGLEGILTRLNRYTIKDDGVARLIYDLVDVGVRFIFLSHLSKTYIDGATFLSHGGPVIAMTGRYDRLDNFFFTIGHEIYHVLHHLKNDNDFFVDDSTQGSSTDKFELEANEGASNALRSKEILNWFRNFYGYLPKTELNNCSKE